MTETRPSMPNVTPIRAVIPPKRVSGRAARAHEEMNALSVISSVVSLLAPGLSECERLRMDRLNRAVDRLRDLIRDDVDEARDLISTHVTETIDVEALGRAVCERLRQRAAQAVIRLVGYCSGGWLEGDAALLRETLLELVRNAIDATLPGREVHLET